MRGARGRRRQDAQLRRAFRKIIVRLRALRHLEHGVAPVRMVTGNAVAAVRHDQLDDLDARQVGEQRPTAIAFMQNARTREQPSVAVDEELGAAFARHLAVDADDRREREAPAVERDLEAAGRVRADAARVGLAAQRQGRALVRQALARLTAAARHFLQIHLRERERVEGAILRARFGTVRAVL